MRERMKVKAKGVKAFGVTWDSRGNTFDSNSRPNGREYWEKRRREVEKNFQALNVLFEFREYVKDNTETRDGDYFYTDRLWLEFIRLLGPSGLWNFEAGYIGGMAIKAINNMKAKLAKECKHGR